MLYRTQYQLDIICKQLIEICQQILILIAKNRDGLDLMEAGEFCDGLEFGFYENMLMLDHSSIVGRKVYIYFTVCALLAVNLLELYACKCLLCNYKRKQTTNNLTPCPIHKTTSQEKEKENRGFPNVLLSYPQI